MFLNCAQKCHQLSLLHPRTTLPPLPQCMSHLPRRKLWQLACCEGYQHDHWKPSCSRFISRAIAIIRVSRFQKDKACAGCTRSGRLRIYDRNRRLLSSWNFCCGKDRISCLFGTAEEAKPRKDRFYQDWLCLKLPRSPWFPYRWGIW